MWMIQERQGRIQCHRSICATMEEASLSKLKRVANELQNHTKNVILKAISAMLNVREQTQGNKETLSRWKIFNSAICNAKMMHSSVSNGSAIILHAIMREVALQNHVSPSR